MTSREPQLCLGTAQFGLPYGITNHRGQVSEDDVSIILKQAAAAGIQRLDTAMAYGNAEAVLGRALAPGHPFALISKFPSQTQSSFSEADVCIWEQSLRNSLEHLGCEQLDALLLHAPADLLKPGAHHLHSWLLSLRQRGVVRRLGVSIYAASDLVALPSELLDLVQLPLSLYDQRLLRDDTITHLRSQGTAIHARSLYLQGLLLQKSEDWPSWTTPSVRSQHQRLEELADRRNCRLLDLALGFARQQTNLEAVVLGLCSERELQDLLHAWQQQNPWQPDEWQGWSIDDPSLLDPRIWPR